MRSPTHRTSPRLILGAAILLTMTGCGTAVVRPPEADRGTDTGPVPVVRDVFVFSPDVLVSQPDVRVAPDQTAVVDVTPVRDIGIADVRAGGACVTDDDCDRDGLLVCAPFRRAGFCTNFCEPGSAAQEEAQCGGRGTTCLQRSRQGIQGMTDALCTRACVPTAQTEARGQCPAGMVCTGFWFNTLVGTPDSPGCYPFCQNDAQCAGLVVGDAGAMRCNTRQGRCLATGVDLSLRADGDPCDPTAIQMNQRAQCRGICFGVDSTNRTRGLCGSFIDIWQTPGCPDTPDQMEPLTRTGDNQGYCLVRNCRTNADCIAPTVCIYRVDQMGVPVMTVPPACLYPTMTQPTGIPADGGVSRADSGA